MIEQATEPGVDYKPRLGAKTDYGIGIIGMGWVASNYHMPAYKLANFNVVATSDINEDALKSAQERWGIEKGFTNYKDMLELEEVEIVDVATRTFNRTPIVVDCAKAGKHLLVQKPFARSYQEGLEMVEAAEKAGVKIGVNSHYRWIVPKSIANYGHGTNSGQ